MNPNELTAAIMGLAVGIALGEYLDLVRINKYLALIAGLGSLGYLTYESATNKDMSNIYTFLAWMAFGVVLNNAVYRV